MPAPANRRSRNWFPWSATSLLKVGEAVTEEEVARARAQLKASLLMALESTSSRAEQLARQLMVFGRPIAVDEVIGKVDAVDVDMVTKAARRLVDSKLTFTALGPTSKIDAYEGIVERLR